MPFRLNRPRPRQIVAHAALVAVLVAAPTAAVTLGEAVALHQSGKLDQALAAYREIAASAASDPERSAARNNACVLLHDRGDFAPALPECAEAVRLRRAAGAKRALAQSLNNWALALQATGARDEARRRLVEALEWNDRLGETEEAVVNLDNLAAFEIENGRYGDALDRLAAAERRVESAAGASWAEEQSRVLRLNRAVVLERLGAWRESLSLLSELAAEPEPDRVHAATLTVDLAVTYRNLGDPRTAERLLARAIDELRRLDDRPALANALLNLGLAAELNLRDPERARGAYEEVRSLARASGDAIAQVQALVGLARVAVAQGDVADADALASEAIALSASIDDPEARWTALDAAARAARAEGGPPKRSIDSWPRSRSSRSCARTPARPRVAPAFSPTSAACSPPRSTSRPPGPSGAGTATRSRARSRSSNARRRASCSTPPELVPGRSTPPDSSRSPTARAGRSNISSARRTSGASSSAAAPSGSPTSARRRGSWRSPPRPTPSSRAAGAPRLSTGWGRSCSME